jgi:SAM-dependent methyltransferase
MSSSDRSRISSYYSTLVERHGDDHRSCDYGRAGSQQIKFGVLSAVIQPGQRILDVGCGMAAYADWLAESGLDVAYTGIDICPDMIKQASRRRPELDLKVADPFEVDGQWDVVTANGIFYLLQESPQTTMKRLIIRMFELSLDCCIFNSLSTWAPDSNSGEFQADPLEVLDFCRGLTPWVVLDHGYMQHDFTMTLRHDSRI